MIDLASSRTFDPLKPPVHMKCFLIMPYGNGLTDPTARDELDALHEHIREAVESVSIEGRPPGFIQCIRGDREARPGEIVRGVIRDLVGSELAIAVLTGHNPNVFYELGVRHAVRSNTMLLAQHEDEVPFDLRTQRLILYANRGLADARLLTRRIQDGIRQMIAETNGDPDNPVLRYLHEHRMVESTVVHETQVTVELRQLRTMVEQLITDRVPPRDAESVSLTTARRSDSEWTDMLGAWVGEASNEARSHFYVRLVRGVPIVLYSYLGDDSATGIYYDLSRSDGRIYGRFRWLEHTDISGFAAFTIAPSDRITGGWWYDDHVPSEVRAGTSTVALDHPGMNPMTWTRSSRPVDPQWVEAWFARADQG